jgi:uncharacterized protein (UPF0210 family)
MKIRAITYFCNPKYPVEDSTLRQAGKFNERAKPAFAAAGYDVQTLRLATIPFPTLLGEAQIDRLPALARELELLIPQVHFGYGSLGPALPEMPRSYEVIPEAIGGTKIMFFSGVMADKGRGIDLAAIRRCAQVIVKTAPLDRNGFANLRFAALANVKPGSPFFPASYFDGTRPAFAIATEAADLAVQAFSAAKTVDEGRRLLIAEIERHAAALARVAANLPGSTGALGGKVPAVKFLGIDLSLAPFPDQSASIGNAFERLGVTRIGAHGSLAAAAILTECIDQAKFPRTGFCGLLLPVLEDATLALRAADGKLTTKDLLLYSAVCGTGLDTIPLPGATTADQLAPLLLDLSALALRLDKQLTARLLPIPSKKAGAPTGFDFAYFANGKVMALDSEGLRGPLAGGESFALRAR